MAINTVKNRRMHDVLNRWIVDNRDFVPPALATTDTYKTVRQAIAKGNVKELTWVSVTPHDTNELAGYAIALYVTGAGDIVVVDADQTNAATTKTYTAVPVGVSFIRARIVKATGTTATGIEALVPVAVTQTDH